MGTRKSWKSNPDLSKPEGLSAEGERAHEAVVAFLERGDLTYTGGCRAFYSPEEWAARGERYGLGAVLVVVHDGGAVGQAFSYDREDYASIEAMAKELEPLGLYAEQCTTWYSAIYRSAPEAKLPAPAKLSRDQAIEAARDLWKSRCQEYVAKNGDFGTCVLGAGIIPRDLTSRQWNNGWVDSSLYLIRASEVSPAQGSCVWEASVEEVLALLKSHGVEAQYHPGRMD